MGSGLKLAGCGGIAVGAITAFIAIQMNTSVHSDASYRYGTFIASSDTINIGLLQNQQLTFLAAGFFFLAGVILLCTGFIVEAVSGGRYAPEAATPIVTTAREEGYQLRARPRDTWTEEERASANRADKFIIMVAAGLGALALLAIFVFGVGTSRPGGSASDQALIMNNAEALADAMEMQADNIDALADNVASSGR